METKILKLKRLLKDASDNNQQIMSYYLNMVFEKIKESSDQNFDVKLLNFMNERVAYANKFVGKKNNKVFEEEIYCLSLLSFTFFNGKYKPEIVENKVILSGE